MKKSNVIVYLVIILVSAFLLWLWYFLGFNHIDEPLDLVISIIWWIIVVVAIVIVVRVEKRRREQIRTLYISDDILFNPELGSINYTDLFDIVKQAEIMLNDLRYNFKKEQMPNVHAFPIKVIIKAIKYKNDEIWEGEITTVKTAQEQGFTNKEELFNILNDSGLFGETDTFAPKA